MSDSVDPAAIQGRVDAATPGSLARHGAWGHDLIGEARCITMDGWDLAVMADRPEQIGGSKEQQRADATFIAHARADVPYLLDLLAAIKDLHRPNPEQPGSCEDCGEDYPCTTWHYANGTTEQQEDAT